MRGKNVQLDKCRTAAVTSSVLPLEMEMKSRSICEHWSHHTGVSQVFDKRQSVPAL